MQTLANGHTQQQTHTHIHKRKGCEQKEAHTSGWDVVEDKQSIYLSMDVNEK